MKITIENYERYVLDFLEGQLGHQDEKEFQQFLNDHLTIKKEIAGIDQVILSPDLEMRYPDKESLYRRKRGGIIPLWNVNRLVAAAVAFLLISASVLFYWNTSFSPDIILTDNQSTKVQDPTEQTELPATKTPMPAEQSETNVMARKGNVPDLEENINQSSPALTFGSSKRDNQFDQNRNRTGISENNEILPESVPIEAIPKLVSSETVEHLAQGNSMTRDGQDMAVEFLPTNPGEITIDPSLKIPISRIPIAENTSSTFEFHIPGQFLSETWGDVSLANIKDQLLPEFINITKNQ